MALAAWMTGLVDDGAPASGSALVAGARMLFTVAGHSPELLLVHGLLGTAAHWEHVLPALAEESRVYAVDALGMGESERVPGLDSGLAAQADRLVAFLDTQGIPRADWVGTSHGGAVVLMLAALHPERVRSLVLHAPSNPFAHEADALIRFYLSRVGRWCAHRAHALPRRLQATALSRMYGDGSPIREGSLTKYVRSLKVPGTTDYVLDVLAGWGRDMVALNAALPRIGNIPTLLLWGDGDRAVSLRSVKMLQQHLQDAELAILPGAGHLPHEEAPEAFAAAVNAFLRKRGRRPAHPGLHLVTG